MITRIIELACDHDGCDVAYAPSPDELVSLQLTRVGSAIAGWTRADGLDYCPKHPRVELADRIRELAGQRLTDGQIARRLGIHRTTVQKQRHEHGIAAGLGRVGRPSSGLTPRRRSAPDLALSDNRPYPAPGGDPA